MPSTQPKSAATTATAAAEKSAATAPAEKSVASAPATTAPDDIVIVSTGCCTALGPNAKRVAAEVAASMSLASKIPIDDSVSEPFTASVLPRAFLPELPEEIADRAYFTRREALLLRFATLALRDCLKEHAALKFKAPPPALFLALPEHETEKPLAPDALLDDLAAINPGTFARLASSADWRGRAGGLLALAAAIASLRSGVNPYALVGGVDTLYDPYIMLGFNARCRIKCESATDYFIPGEGAGFLLLTTRATATAAGLTPLATVAVPASDIDKGPWPGYVEEFDEKTETPTSSDALATAVGALLKNNPPSAPIQDVYSTMNGESFWAKEWGVARIRNSRYFAEKDKMHHPAEFYGDIGAASAPVMLALVVDAFQEADVKSPVLLYASSDKGERAATLVSKPE
jgi:3-oxoacyl-[acyl-carrier-protein] synthase-1